MALGEAHFSQRARVAQTPSPRQSTLRSLRLIQVLRPLNRQTTFFELHQFFTSLPYDMLDVNVLCKTIKCLY